MPFKRVPDFEGAGCLTRNRAGKILERREAFGVLARDPAKFKVLKDYVIALVGWTQA